MLFYWLCFLILFYRINLTCFVDHLNSLLLIFCSFSFLLSILFPICLKECVWFKNLLLLKSDINPKHFSFFAIDFNVSNKLSPIPRGYQSFKDFRPSPQFIRPDLGQGRLPNNPPPRPVDYVLSKFSILPPHPPFILTPLLLGKALKSIVHIVTFH